MAPSIKTGLKLKKRHVEIKLLTEIWNIKMIFLRNHQQFWNLALKMTTQTAKQKPSFIAVLYNVGYDITAGENTAGMCPSAHLKYTANICCWRILSSVMEEFNRETKGEMTEEDNESDEEVASDFNDRSDSEQKLVLFHQWTSFWQLANFNGFIPPPPPENSSLMICRYKHKLISSFQHSIFPKENRYYQRWPSHPLWYFIQAIILRLYPSLCIYK